ncbi:MAG: ribose transport system permease protein [Subtercola sp.]|nr:ribose transport system permease protein [Subtercola sp.]
MSESNAPEMLPRRQRLSFQWSPLAVILVANVLLVVYLQVFAGQNLAEPRTLSTLTPLLGVMVLIGLAQAFVIGTGGIDLSIPSVITLMGIMMLRESGGENDQLPKALLVAAIVCIAIGLVNGVLVEVLGLNALVTTLATGQLVLGATVIYREGALKITKVPSELSTWAQANLFGFSFILIVAVVLALVILFFVRRVATGRRLVLASASLRASQLTGLHHLSLRVLAWVIASLVAGVGGVLLAGQLSSPDMSSGGPYLLLSIVVVVLGGAVLTGGRVGPLGTLFGATFIILLDHGLAVQGFSTGARTLVQGLVLALGLAGVGLLMRPRTAKSRTPTEQPPPAAPDPALQHA